MAPGRVMIRGIYATALTRLLEDSFRIVQPSPAIDRRFDQSFVADAVDAELTTTDDRQGVGLTGDRDTIETLREQLTDVGIDTLFWRDPAPRGAVFEATVIDTLGGGAVVELGDREGYLPFDAAHGHVVEGDQLRVQVHRPIPPWAEARPEVDMEIRAFGGLVDLVRGSHSHRAEVADPERATELVRATEVVPTSIPDDWAVRWQPPASDAETSTLDTALGVAVERAESIETILQDCGDPPESTTWIWFGRDSRFALDSIRSSVIETMPGHHRIKAATAEASAAVDFAERLCAPDGSFPFDLVADQFGPDTGDEIEISHGKPDGSRYSLGRAVVADRSGQTVTVRREMRAGGEYDALGVNRADGDIATTKLKEGRWWYPTAYRSEEGDVKGTYVNVCTPVELFPSAATYVDLEVDVVKHADGSVERVDDDDLDAAVANGHISEALAAKAREVATAVERALG